MTPRARSPLPRRSPDPIQASISIAVPREQDGIVVDEQDASDAHTGTSTTTVVPHRPARLEDSI